MEKDIYQQMQLKDDFVRMTQQANLERACANSCRTRKREIKGETYVSKNPNRQEKITAAKQALFGFVALAVMIGGVKVVGDMDAADDIRGEITKKEATYDSNNGTHGLDYVYDDGFVDAMIDLNDGSLVKLFNETSKEMKAEGNVNESNIVSEVVEEMEEDYIEEHGRTM